MGKLKPFLLFFALAFLAFTAYSGDSQSRQYVLVLNQHVSPDSASLTESTVDFSALTDYFTALGGQASADAEKKFKETIGVALPQACDKILKKDKTLECAAENLSITLKKNFTAKEGYYTFEVTGEFPYRTYRVVVNRIPLDRFGKALQQGVGPGDSESESAFSVFSGAIPVDLKKKDDNAISAAGFEMLHLDVLYSVEMPGEITMATAGNYSAEISGSAAHFDIVAVMKDSSPLIIESRELNVFLIIISSGVLLLALITLAFFRFRKKDRF